MEVLKTINSWEEAVTLAPSWDMLIETNEVAHGLFALSIYCRMRCCRYFKSFLRWMGDSSDFLSRHDFFFFIIWISLMMHLWLFGLLILLLLLCIFITFLMVIIFPILSLGQFLNVLLKLLLIIPIQEGRVCTHWRVDPPLVNVLVADELFDLVTTGILAGLVKVLWELCFPVGVHNRVIKMFIHFNHFRFPLV